MAWTVSTNRSVMIAVAAIPVFSISMASCIQHDEQLPQSPTAEITAAQDANAVTTSAGAGRVKSGFVSRRTWATPYCERSMASMWSSSSRTRILPLSMSPTVHPPSVLRRAGPDLGGRAFAGGIEHTYGHVGILFRWQGAQ